MGKFVVAGITQVETIVRVDKVPIVYTPLTTEINSIYTGLGGDAYNESLALRWLGDDVKFMSIIGRDRSVDELNPPGNEILLSTEYVVQSMDETPNCVILYDKERRKQIFEDIKDLRDTTYDMSMFAPLAGWADMVVLANANFCRPFAVAAAEYNKKLAVNIRNFCREKEKYNREFLDAASILYFSDDQLEEDPYEFIKSISKTYGTDIIIMGRGSKGVILFDKAGGFMADYKTVKTNEIVNTVGAGNALFACFLHYYQETGDSVNSIKNALLFSSYKIGYMGTSKGFMTTEQMEQWRNLIWGIRPDGL